MASKETRDLVQEFEDAFKRTLSAVTEKDDLNEKDQGSLMKNTEEKVSQFADAARRLEIRFLQGRLITHQQKPEMILKEDTAELKAELLKKDELIRKHYEKLGQLKTMLADVQAQSSSNNQLPSTNPLQQGQERRQGGPPGGHGVSSHPALAGGGQTQYVGFVPGNNYSRSPGQQPMYGQQNRDGSLAYLERATSNIDGPGVVGVNTGVNMGMNR